MMRCPTCWADLRAAEYGYAFECDTHGAIDFFAAQEWNDADVQVWLRSKDVSYSKVLPRRILMKDGTILAPEYKDFKWEKWP